ncbi:MAG: A/G-specific adenine glycosylase [Myxococcales bacterium]|nr:A/G-specific adenine glycosylase [Myxococcales bacterium]
MADLDSAFFAAREVERGASWAEEIQGEWKLEETERSAFRASLVSWFQQQQRDLPWRATRDPYAIWLSEIMLQQTRVETVIPYYHRFLERFPTVRDLAAASLEEVLSLWSGLGYYRRARMLHQAAQVVVSEHEGEFPSTHKDLLSLPGIGRYTAGAIASIAFSEEAPLVDGNVFRIFARLFSLTDAIGSKELERACWQLAASLVRGESPGDLNQALMELGATLCFPKKPSCLLCPVRAWCRSFAAGTQAELPTPKAPKETPIWQVMWGLFVEKGRVLMIQRPHAGLFAGMWEFPGLYRAGEEAISAQEWDDTLAEMGIKAAIPPSSAKPYKHILTHRQLAITTHTILQWEKMEPSVPFRWVELAHLGELPISSIVRRVLHDLAADSLGG